MTHNAQHTQLNPNLSIAIVNLYIHKVIIVGSRTQFLLDCQMHKCVIVSTCGVQLDCKWQSLVVYKRYNCTQWYEWNTDVTVLTVPIPSMHIYTAGAFPNNTSSRELIGLQCIIM